jgi:lysophospholipase L1-like esterase
MTIRESELRERLSVDDDEGIFAALVEHFEPVFENTPFLHRWRARAGLVVDDDGRPMTDALGHRLMDLANSAQRAWRLHRFLRLRDEAPHLPVVVCEGDSWVAHPLIDDITDHLLDDERYPLLALGVGAAADVLGRISSALEHEQAIATHGAKALLLSGGGNDLMRVFPRFLHRWTPGHEPLRLLTEAVDTEIHALMGTLRSMLARLEDRVPVVVHGYDHLRVRALGKGGQLAPFFDTAGIDEPAERCAVLWGIVDRYNEHLRAATDDMRWVTYVDVRGVVVDDAEWHDDIHPTADGFGRITERIADALLERLR